MPRIDISRSVQWASGSYDSWHNVASSDLYRYYLGDSTYEYRSRFIFTVPSTLSIGSVNKFVVRMRNDTASTPKYMRAFLSDTNYVNQGSDRILTGHILATSYLYTAENKTSRATSYQSSPVDSYLVFNYPLTAGATYYIYLIPYSSDSSAQTSPTYGGTWYRGRNDSTYLSFTLDYNLPSYTITYHANGGSTTPGVQTKPVDASITLAGAISRANYVENGPVVSFNKNGGSSAPASITSSIVTKYTFAGWNTAPDGSGTTYSAGATYSTNANLDLYAKWTSSRSQSPITLPNAISRSSVTADGYTVTLDGNGGSVTPSSVTARNTTSYTFAGWNTNSSGTGANYNAGASFTPQSNTTLYAKWTAVTVRGSVTLPTPVRGGVQFLGWSRGSGDPIVGSYTPTQSETLVALWSSGGSIPIDNGSGWDLYRAFIDNGVAFESYTPYIDNGSGWDILS